MHKIEVFSFKVPVSSRAFFLRLKLEAGAGKSVRSRQRLESSLEQSQQIPQLLPRPQASASQGVSFLCLKTCDEVTADKPPRKQVLTVSGRRFSDFSLKPVHGKASQSCKRPLGAGT